MLLGKSKTSNDHKVFQMNRQLSSLAYSFLK